MWLPTLTLVINGHGNVYFMGKGYCVSIEQWKSRTGIARSRLP